jgi:hypothetical protein
MNSQQDVGISPFTRDAFKIQGVSSPRERIFKQVSGNELQRVVHAGGERPAEMVRGFGEFLDAECTKTRNVA